MSRVGGGGYAESRGGVGDRTGGGMSGNARDGRDGMGNRSGRGGYSTGMYGATMRRTPVQSPSYDASLHNFGQLGKEVLSFAGGPVTTAAKAIAGYGPNYTGYRGQVSTPGSYDPKDTPQMGPNGQRAYRRPMPANIAKAQALAPALHNPLPMAAQPWWRTPF